MIVYYRSHTKLPLVWYDDDDDDDDGDEAREKIKHIFYMMMFHGDGI